MTLPPPPLLLSLLLLLCSGAAATSGSHCFSLGESRTDRGQHVTEVRVNPSCRCANLSLHVCLSDASGLPSGCEPARGCPSPGNSWHSALQTAPVRNGSATFRTVVGACFQARCDCAVDGPHCAARHWQWPGLNISAYNLVVSHTQLPGAPLRVRFTARPLDHQAQFYFPRLKMSLRSKDAGSYHASKEVPTEPLEPGAAEADTQAVAEFGGVANPLPPGPYRLELKPAGSWVCQGNNNGCRRVEHTFLLEPVARGGPASRALPPGQPLKALYAVIGVALALFAAGVVFIWREWASSRAGQGQPLQAKAAAPSGAHVLLVHLWPPWRAAQLSAELRAAGVSVTDAHEPELRRLLLAMPVADVLSVERLRRAKIVFLCPEERADVPPPPATTLEPDFAGPGGAAATAPRVRQALFAAVCAWVRNSALALDYRRVLVVLPEGGRADLDGLVPGCRFRWPGDSAELVRQLTAAPEPEPADPACGDTV